MLKNLLFKVLWNFVGHFSSTHVNGFNFIALDGRHTYFNVQDIFSLKPLNTHSWTPLPTSIKT